MSKRFRGFRSKPKEPVASEQPSGDIDTNTNREQAKTESRAAEAKAKELATKKANQTAQAVRDAHYYENGVKADGTGGVPPESEQ